MEHQQVNMMAGLDQGYGLDPSHNEPHDTSEGRNIADILQNRDLDDDDSPRGRMQ